MCQKYQHLVRCRIVGASIVRILYQLKNLSPDVAVRRANFTVVAPHKLIRIAAVDLPPLFQPLFDPFLPLRFSPSKMTCCLVYHSYLAPPPFCVTANWPKRNFTFQGSGNSPVAEWGCKESVAIE